MVRIQDLIQLSSYEWEIPATYRADMRVPVRIYASRALLDQVAGDNSLEQAVNAATLPGLVGKVVVMPDMHQGYGFPIGGVAATVYPKGVISPGAIGYDINCGVRLLASRIELEAALPHLDTLATVLNQYCPSGWERTEILPLRILTWRKFSWKGRTGHAKRDLPATPTWSGQKKPDVWRVPFPQRLASVPKPGDVPKLAQ